MPRSQWPRAARAMTGNLPRLQWTHTTRATTVKLPARTVTGVRQWANCRACDGQAQQGQQWASHRRVQWPRVMKATTGKLPAHAATATSGKLTACAGSAIKITITQQRTGAFDGGGIGRQCTNQIKRSRVGGDGMMKKSLCELRPPFKNNNQLNDDGVT